MNTLTKFPLVQYAGLDYNNALADLKNIIIENPKWLEKWGNFYDSDSGILLSQMMAYLADNLSTRIDYAVNESYISTATQDKNKLRLLKLINYRPTLAKAAKLLVEIELESVINDKIENKIIFTPSKKTTDALADRASKIMKITATDINGNSTIFEAIPVNKITGKYEYFDEFSAEVTSNLTYVTEYNTKEKFTLIQGETKYNYFYSYESDSVYFDLPYTNIIEGSIRLYNNSFKEYLQVKNFIQREALKEEYSVPYIISNNEDGTIRISFASSKILSSETRRYPASSGLNVFYRIGGGKEGNIPVRFLNRTINLSLYKGGIINANIYNDTIGSGGEDAETASEAVINGPLSTRTVEKAVTPEDYDIILNKYADLLKVKTFSSVNIPSEFKDVYGRYLNPQEVFSLILFNKEHGTIPSSKYNYFPWLELNHENRFNEVYSFANSNFNDKLSLSFIDNKLTIVEDGSTSKLFTNFIAIEPAEKIGNSLYEDDGVTPNDNLLVKLTKEETTERYFSEIDFNLFEGATVRESFLNANNPVIEENVNAKYLSIKGLDPLEAIDIKKYGEIGVVIDEKGIININLLEGLSQTVLEKEHVYRYLTNEVPISDSGYTYTGTAAEAAYRLGIVEIMNMHLFSNDPSGAYYEEKSIQYLGSGKQSPLSDVPIFKTRFGDGVTPFQLVCKINGLSYRFSFGNTVYLASSSFISPSDAGYATPTNLIGITAMMKYNLSDGVYLYDSETDTWGTKKNSLYSNIGFDYDLVKRYVPPSESEEDDYDYTSSFDMFFYSKTAAGFNDVDEKYISVDYEETVPQYYSLLHTMAGINENINIKTYMPAVIEAANYSNCFGIETKDLKQYLKITSPLVGKTSSLFFIKVVTDGNKDDFMNSFYNVSYITSEGDQTAFAVSSSKVFGIKRATLLLKNQEIVILNGVAQDYVYKAGTIIYENNCLNKSIDFGDYVYCTYKTDSNNKIVLGSIYENYYNTGTASIDEKLKTKVTGLLGSAVKEELGEDGITKIEVEDYDKSNYYIKFSSSVHNEASIFAIEDTISVNPVKRLSLETAELSDPGETLAKRLIFSIDDVSYVDAPFVVELPSSFTSSFLKAAIETAVEMKIAKETETRIYNEYVSDIVRYSYDTKKCINIGNISKTSSGNIRFIYDTTSTLEENKALYKALFGTYSENPDLYNTYKAGNTINPLNVSTIDAEDYFLFPTEEYPLVFKTYGDYYVDREYDEVTKNYVYSLIKTANSNLQDKPFYLNFVNDKTRAKKEDGNPYETEEKALKNYISKYTISGMENSFGTPLFITFDLKAKVFYNSSFSETEVRNTLRAKLEKLYFVDNREIGSSLSKSSVFNAIMTVTGVTGVNIIFFGTNVGLPSTNETDEITAAFNEIIVLHENVYSSTSQTRGLMLTYEKE